ncbi:MAG: hypothetical protein IJW19_02250 [Clostridia bacterium]|nr:hypothetical protein [Clostridia bacterium]
MVKVICKKEYNTETAELVKKVTVGEFGDPTGYEETLYVTADGYFFLYTNGGEESLYPVESIKRMSKKTADEWLAK